MKTLLLFFSFISCYYTASAQGLFQSALDSTSTPEQNTTVSLNGYARGSVYGGGETYHLASTFAELSLQAQLKKGHAYFMSDIRLRKGVLFGGDDQQLQVKELYAGYRGDKLDVLLGNQIINWGRTDGFNPTNNITPNDYFFLSANPDDQKESNFMLRFKYRLVPSIELELIGIPFYRTSNYRYDLFALGPNVSFANTALPARELKNGSLAARLNFDLPSIGFSVSYFRGYDPYHGFDVQNIDWSTGTPYITNRATPYMKNTVGADLAIPIRNWIIRAELAYNRSENPDDKMYIPLTDLAYVAGLESNWNGFTIIGQYIGKYSPDYIALTPPTLTDPTNPLAQMQYANDLINYENRLFNRRIFYQQEKMNHAAVLSVSKSFGYDAWNAELATYHNFTSDEWLVRPKISWKINDSLTASLGGSYMTGPVSSLFDYSAPIMNGGFMELKASF